MSAPNIMIIRTGAAIPFLFWACSAHPAQCLADTPAAAAKWVHDHDRELLPPVKAVKTALSSELFSLLKKEHECVERTNEICAIDFDLWTNTQDGDILGPITFNESEATKVSATVLMKYKFALYEDGRDAKDWITTVRLIRPSEKACWAVDDIIGPEGLSLKKQLRLNLTDGT